MSHNVFRTRPCWFCLAPEGARIRIDKRGKPYLHCECCGTYAFLRTPSSIYGLAVVAPVVEQLVARMQSNPDYQLQQREAIRLFRNELSDTLTLRDSSSAATADSRQMDETSNRKTG